MSGDTLFPKVALLLQGDSFSDRSNSNATTHSGSLALTQAFPGIVASSYWFKSSYTGVVMYVDHPAAAEIPAARDFAVEITAFCQKNNRGGALFSNRTPGGNADGLLIGLDTTGRPFVRVTDNGVLKLAIDGILVAAADSLHTIKVHRKNGVWGLMLDGVPQIDLGHQPIYNSAIEHGDKLYVGCDPYTVPFVGGFNQLRLTIGDARQTTAYTPDIEPWPIYATEPNILFGELSSNVSTHSAAVDWTVNVENAASITVSAVNGAGAGVGSGWAISEYPVAGQNVWRITGVAPAALADYNLVLTGVTTELFGSLARSQNYHIYNTEAGVLDEEQNLLASIGSAKLWLDGSDLSTISSSAGSLDSILNKIDSLPFNAAPARPKPVLNTSAFALNSIGFIENASSALVSPQPVVLSSETSQSTIILVGKYIGQQLGQGSGLFQISYTEDDAREDGTASWVLTTTQTGVDNAAIAMYDSSARQDGIASDPTIMPGEAFVVAWRAAQNTADLWVNQRLVSENEIAGTLGFWDSVSSAISFIGGSQSPGGAFIALGELIAFDGNLPSSQLEAVLSLVNHKWQIYPNVPFAQSPSTLTGYVGNAFVATTIVTDATSVDITASAGINWTIVPSGSGVTGEYRITGHLPDTPQALTLTIDTSNGGVVGQDVYEVQVLALPDTPTILTPLNLHAQAQSGFASLVFIFGAEDVSITGSAGSDWAISPAPSDQDGNYLITGTAPNTVGSLTLTLTASKLDTQSNLVVSTTSIFTVVVTASLVEDQPQYQVDLTGLLASNKIVEESQTLSSANGVKQQLLIPIFAPYFGNSLQVQYYSPSGDKITAQSGVDYVCVMRQLEMSHLCQSDIYSGILAINPALRGAMFLTYQTLGGGFSVDRRSMMEELVRVAHETRFIGWNAVTGKPVYFPVAGHFLNIQEDALGLASIVTALEGLRNSISLLNESDVIAMTAHIANLSNPHAATAAQIGLGLVQNFQLASQAEAAAGASAQRYLTPKTAAIAIIENLPVSQNTVSGKFMLNLGTLPGDDTDSTKPLTATGAVNLLIAPEPNALNSLFSSVINQAEQPVLASPAPLVFPLWWKGLRCADEIAFASAVRSYTGLRALRYNRDTFTFYFPVDVTPPSLVTTQAYSSSGAQPSDVMSPMDFPLLISS